MTLHKLIQEMHSYNRTVAQDGECDAWQDFMVECFSRYEVGPWDEVAEDVQAAEGFADYWLDVPKGTSYDYSAGTGARLEADESFTVEEFIVAFEKAGVDLLDGLRRCS
ncbi:hypothetical protein RZS28_00555 [Methylocapsa polymorpha]|uniref:Uncharacterized protein n=1 Tax=Methylocapsa polymorpha TaxID=3080828 RepID=A0ABZ0HSQ2_9HYPH|nr:hypothetical protein RZS28_00555 [Methylocapsa sp. RX1]